MKLIIDINDNDYELINKTVVTLDLHTVLHGKEKDKEMTFAIFDLVKALKNGIPYEERPQVNVIPQECIKILAETVVDAVQQIDWKALCEKMAERPKGKWTIVDDVYCECPFCKNREVKFSKYCPECGADMRKGDES